MIRVYNRTTFSELKRASCLFWKVNDQAYILTDEYYNDLATVHEPVLDFFRSEHVPWN